MGSVIWLTGLSGAGKTTISRLVEDELSDNTLSIGRVVRLDGDLLREGLCKDLGFSPEDRAENMRRVAELASLLSSLDHFVIVALISPFAEERYKARMKVEKGGGRFYELYINTPIHVVEKRDVKGLYRMARCGEVNNFTGIDSPYEPPSNPDLIVSTENMTPEQSAAQVIDFLVKKGIV